MHTREALIVMFFVAAIAGLYIVEAGLLLVALLAGLKRKKRQLTKLFFSRPAIALHLLAVLGLLGLLYGFCIEPYWVQVNRFEIASDKLAGTSLRIVHISDIHCNKKIVNERKLPGIVNALKPDIIVFTGDCLNDPCAVPLFKETMKSLTAQIGKYAVTGNVDLLPWSPPDIFDGTGFVQLDNDTVAIEKDGQTIYISGLGALYSSVKFHQKLPTIPNQYFSILLHHCPDFAEELSGLNIDLYLAGHTHGGQIRIPFYGPLITFSKFGRRYAAGLHDLGSTILYVNRGVGLEGGPWPRARFLVRPEVAVFDIRPSKQPGKIND